MFQELPWESTGAAAGFKHEDGSAQVAVPRGGAYQISAAIPMMSTDDGDTGTACIAVNDVEMTCQSVWLPNGKELRVIPLTTILELAPGDVVTLRFKGTSTSVQVFAEMDFMSVMTIANVD